MLYSTIRNVYTVLPNGVRENWSLQKGKVIKIEVLEREPPMKMIGMVKLRVIKRREWDRKHYLHTKQV